MEEKSLQLEVRNPFFDQVDAIKYKLQHRHFKIRDLYQFHRDDHLRFDTEYQRTAVWTKKKNRLLIDSILRKYDISMIFLRECINNNRLHYECIDGQQRLGCIFKFINNEFDITPDVTPGLDRKYFYHELPQDYQNDIKIFEVNSIVVSDANDDITTDIFMRLQEGVRLNDAEKLNAIGSKMRSAVIDTSKHNFFPSTSLKNIRFAYRHYAAQLLTLSQSPETSDVGFPHLRRTYYLYKDGFPQPAVEKTTRSLTILTRILGSNIRAVRSKSDIPILHLIASNLLPDYSINGFEKSIGEFILKFISEVGKLSHSANERDQNSLIRYAYYRKFAYLHIQDKFKIMASELLQTIPKLKPKDRQRYFNETERIAICLKAKHKCEKCHQNTPLEKGHADHKVRHTDGGLTVIENGRWFCKACHNVLHTTRS